MANSKEIAQIVASSSGIVNKTVYRGNVQSIPVTLEADLSAGVYYLSETLPQNTVVIAVNLDVDNIGTTFEVGTDADTESALIITQATISGDTRVQFPAHDKGAGSIAVGGKKLIATIGATPTASKAVSGYILIATQE